MACAISFRSSQHVNLNNCANCAGLTSRDESRRLVLRVFDHKVVIWMHRAAENDIVDILQSNHVDNVRLDR